MNTEIFVRNRHEAALLCVDKTFLGYILYTYETKQNVLFQTIGQSHD